MVASATAGPVPAASVDISSAKTCSRRPARLKMLIPNSPRSGFARLDCGGDIIASDRYRIMII